VRRSCPFRRSERDSQHQNPTWWSGGSGPQTAPFLQRSS
jgi:hypothetical protein